MSHSGIPAQIGWDDFGLFCNVQIHQVAPIGLFFAANLKLPKKILTQNLKFLIFYISLYPYKN